MVFGERLKKLRDEKGYTQGDLAKHLGVSQPTIGEYEAGKKTPRPDKLIKIAELFNTSIDYLLGKTDNKDPIDKIKKEIESSTPDLEKILKHTRPTYRGKPITEEQARMWNKFFESLFGEEGINQKGKDNE